MKLAILDTILNSCVLAELGHYELSQKIFKQTIAVFQAVNQLEHAEKVKTYAGKHYGILV